MKTTYPYKWKANRKDNNQIIEGRVLTTNGYSIYGILDDVSVVEACISNRSGWEIKSDTIYWQCYQCKEWNPRKVIKCNHCNAILDKFKDDEIKDK